MMRWLWRRNVRYTLIAAGYVAYVFLMWMLRPFLPEIPYLREIFIGLFAVMFGGLCWYMAGLVRETRRINAAEAGRLSTEEPQDGRQERSSDGPPLD